MEAVFDDHAAGTVFIGGVVGHGLCCQAGHVEGADQIDVDGLLKHMQRVRASFAERGGCWGDAGAVHRSGDGAHGGFGLSNGGGHACLICDVCLVKGAAQFCGDLGSNGVVEIKQRDFGALGREMARGGFSQARRAARDHGRGVCEFS